MTNSEKAKERARQIFPCPNEDEQRRITELAYNDACEWKDKQFREYLKSERKHYEKKYDLLKDNEFNQPEADKSWCIYHYLDEIINELFKEEKK